MSLIHIIVGGANPWAGPQVAATSLSAMAAACSAYAAFQSYRVNRSAREEAEVSALIRDRLELKRAYEILGSLYALTTAEDDERRRTDLTAALKDLKGLSPGAAWSYRSIRGLGVVERILRMSLEKQAPDKNDDYLAKRARAEGEAPIFDDLGTAADRLSAKLEEIRQRNAKRSTPKIGVLTAVKIRRLFGKFSRRA